MLYKECYAMNNYIHITYNGSKHFYRMTQLPDLSSTNSCLSVKKDKAVTLQAWSGPERSRKLRFPDFMITAQDGG